MGKFHLKFTEQVERDFLGFVKLLRDRVQDADDRQTFTRIIDAIQGEGELSPEDSDDFIALCASYVYNRSAVGVPRQATYGYGG